MHRTLFTPAMIETFRSCKRAYELAFIKYSNGGSPVRASVICKKFILRALAEINRGKLETVNQVQKYMGQNWPVEKLDEHFGEKEKATRAFLFAYKSLTKYVARQYRPHGSQVVAVALKVRARIAHVRVYVEDTLDLVLFYPDEKRLEIVDFQLQPLKPIDPAWPSSSVLVKYCLAERLKTRWPFEKITLTSYRVGTQDFQPVSINLEESLYRLHWAELVKTLEDMKEGKVDDSKNCALHGSGSCQPCRSLIAQLKASTVEEVSAASSASSSTIRLSA